MKKKTKTNNEKLQLSKETVAILNETQAGIVRGGDNEKPKSTQWDFTCTWCTTILPPPDENMRGVQ